MKRAAMVAMMLGLATFVFGEPQASSPQKPATSQTGGAQPGASQSGAAQQSQGQQPGAPQPGAAPATPTRSGAASTDTIGAPRFGWVMRRSGRSATSSM